jgi:hypothetical protein
MPLHDLDIPELRKARNWSANAGQTTGTQTGGMRAIVMAGGTDTARTFSAASRSGRLHRIGWPTAATAGSIVTLRQTALEFALEDSFSVHYRFKITDPADVTGARMFIGCRSLSGALTNVDPGTLTNVVGIGHNSGETTLRVYGADGTAGTPVDLGSGFSALASFAGFFDFTITGLGADGAFWRAIAWDDAISGEPSAAASGKFERAPSPTTAITALTAMRTNNATALAVSLDFAAIHISTL